MRILHLYPQDDPQLTEYVSMLGSNDDIPSPDIVHVHGCWNQDIINKALSFTNARYVISTHGQLQPWVRKDYNALQQTRQKSFLSKCHAVIARGRLEQKNLLALGWNPRVEMVPNPFITSTTTPEKTGTLLETIYQKTSDSNVWQNMTAESRTMISCLLKAAIMQDRRYVRQEIPSDVNWRHILLYGSQENVSDLLTLGMQVLGIAIPDIDVSRPGYYLPEHSQKAEPLHQDVATIIATLRKQPCIRHLADLHIALSAPDINDEQLRIDLKDRNLLKHAQRLMAILQELTLLDEGFMPFAPINDKQTLLIREQIDNHLRI